jgi:hypothetical protein
MKDKGGRMKDDPPTQQAAMEDKLPTEKKEIS